MDLFLSLSLYIYILSHCITYVYHMGSALCRLPLNLRWEVVWWCGVAGWWCVGVVVVGGVAVVAFVVFIAGLMK